MVDIFKKHVQNGISTKLDAWLAFLSMDDADTVIRLIKEYPEFRPMYEQLYDMCRNVERVMGMFSEELKILDKNTVSYMIDELQDENDELRARNIEQTDRIEGLTEQVEEQTEQLEEQAGQIKEQAGQIEDLTRRIKELESLILKSAQ